MTKMEGSCTELMGNLALQWVAWWIQLGIARHSTSTTQIITQNILGISKGWLKFWRSKAMMFLDFRPNVINLNAVLWQHNVAAAIFSSILKTFSMSNPSCRHTVRLLGLAPCSSQ